MPDPGDSRDELRWEDSREEEDLERLMEAEDDAQRAAGYEALAEEERARQDAIDNDDPAPGDDETALDRHFNPPSSTPRPTPRVTRPPGAPARSRITGPPLPEPIGPEPGATITPAPQPAEGPSGSRQVIPPGRRAPSSILAAQEAARAARTTSEPDEPSVATGNTEAGDQATASATAHDPTVVTGAPNDRGGTDYEMTVGGTVTPNGPDTDQPDQGPNNVNIVATLPVGLTTSATVSRDTSTDQPNPIEGRGEATLDSAVAAGTGTVRPPDETIQGSGTRLGITSDSGTLTAEPAGRGRGLESLIPAQTIPTVPVVYISRIERFDTAEKAGSELDLEDLMRRAGIAADETWRTEAERDEIDEWRRRLHKNLWEDDKPDTVLVGRCASQLADLLRPHRQALDTLAAGLQAGGATPDAATRFITDLERVLTLAGQLGNPSNVDETATANQLEVAVNDLDEDTSALPAVWFSTPDTYREAPEPTKPNLGRKIQAAIHAAAAIAADVDKATEHIPSIVKFAIRALHWFNRLL